jgi:hypothetical protein
MVPEPEMTGAVMGIFSPVITGAVIGIFLFPLLFPVMK